MSAVVPPPTLTTAKKTAAYWSKTDEFPITSKKFLGTRRPDADVVCVVAIALSHLWLVLRLKLD